MKNRFTLIAFITFMLFSIYCPAQVWTPVGGPEGANVTTIASTTDYLVVGSNNDYNPGGVWLKDNDGGEWTNVALNMVNKKVMTLGVYENTLFVSNTNHYNENDGGVYRSTDNGITWQNVLPTAPYFNCFLTHNNILYAASGTGWVYQTADNGISWTSSNEGLVVNSANYCMISYGDSLLVGTGRGIYFSTDGGAYWQPLNNGINTTSTWGRIYGITAIGDNLYAATFRNGVYKSANRGASWSLINNGITDLYMTTIFSKDNYVFAANSQGVLKFDNDGGTQWNPSNEGLPGTRIHTFYDSGNKIIIGTQSGLYESFNNGESWTDANSGLAGHTIGNQLYSHEIMIQAENYLITGTSNGAMYKSADGGISWQLASNGITATGFIRSIFYTNNTLYAYYQSGVAYSSTDFGQTWQSMPNGLASLYQILVDGNRLWAANYTLMYSDDFGMTWYDDPNVPTEVLRMCKKNNDLFVTTLEPYTTNSIIYRSVNGTEPFMFAGQVTGIVFNDICALGDTLFGFPNDHGVYISTDNGATWTPDGEGLSGDLIRNASISGNKLFARTRSEIFLRTNTNTWVKINADLPDILDDHDWYNSGLMATDESLFAAVSSLSLYKVDMDAFVLPEQPGVIVGNSSPCVGSQAVYTVPEVAGVTYQWIVPYGWSILSGNTTHSITVVVGSLPGVVMVTPVNLLGSGPAQIFPVVPTNLPPTQPGPITGPTNPLEGTSQIYSVEAVEGYTYNWTFPEGWVQTAGGNTNQATVMVGSSSGVIQVTATSLCGTSEPAMLAVGVGTIIPAVFQVTGGGSYCVNSEGLPVGLSDSELNVTYILFNNNVQQSPTMPGTGEPITFGIQTEGTYTIKAQNEFTLISMTGSAVITELELLNASVQIAPDINGVCSGTAVTFTAFPENGGTPSYQWFVNDNPVGNNTETYTYTPANNDEVYVIMTSNLECVINNPVTSSPVIMIVAESSVVSVNIETDQNDICEGTEINLEAQGINGGNAVYQWYLNGSEVGENQATYSFIPENNDQVYVIMTSDLACISNNPATSNTIEYNVNETITAEVTITPSENPISSGTLITITPNPVNGGDPTYAWYVNSNLVGNGSYYSYIPEDGDQVYVEMVTSVECALQDTVTSNTIIVDVIISTQNISINDLNVYLNANTLFVNNQMGTVGTLSLYSSTGQLIAGYRITGEKHQAISTNLAPGVYLVRAIAGNLLKTTKVIIK